MFRVHGARATPEHDSNQRDAARRATSKRHFFKQFHFLHDWEYISTQSPDIYLSQLF